MFNPLVDSFDKLTDAEVETKVVELQRKYFMARSPEMQIQVQAILEMYREEASARRAKQYIQQNNQDDGEKGLDNLINIS